MEEPKSHNEIPIEWMIEPVVKPKALIIQKSIPVIGLIKRFTMPPNYHKLCQTKPPWGGCQSAIQSPKKRQTQILEMATLKHVLRNRIFQKLNLHKQCLSLNILNFCLSLYVD